MRFPHGLRALNHRDYRRFFTGQAVSLIGTWMQTVAQAWLVLELTHSAFRLGLVSAVQFAPMLLLSVVAGAVVDRVPKRRLLMATQGVLALHALSLGILVATGAVQYWHVLGLAVLAGLANTLDMPARQSFVAGLVAREDLINAVALNSAAFNSARIVGPAVAGLVIARHGTAPAFLANGVSFLVVIAALASLRVEGRTGAARAGSLLAEIGEGLRYAWQTGRILMMLALLFVVSLCVFNFAVYVPLFTRNVLGRGAEGFGFLMAALGVGAVTGALGMGSMSRAQPPLGLVAGAAGVACTGILAMSAVRDFGLAAGVLFVVGASSIIAVTGCNTTLQMAAPDALRGRVMSLHTLTFGGTIPVGAFVTGSLAERWGVTTALAAAGATGLIGVAAVALWWRRAER